MNELFSLGFILLLALLAGHLVQFLRIPEVSGYILAGVALGPSVLHWVSHDNLLALQVFSEVALGLILFSIGSVFEFGHFRKIGRRALIITGVETVLTAGTVFLLLKFAGMGWAESILLGMIAVETAAASTMMVIRELDSEGPLTETLLGVIAINNIFCLALFTIAASMLELALNLGGSEGLFSTIYEAVWGLSWQLVGSAALGYLVGLMLASWASKVVEHGETLILLAGCVLLCVGAAQVLGLSPMLASLAVGATMANLSAKSRRLFRALSRTDPPLYAIFFVIAGAELDLARLPTLGILGAAYIVGRIGGKLLGATLGSWWLGMGGTVKKHLGLAILSQAGLAVGLTLAVGRKFPQYADTISTIVLSAIIVFEMIGPVSAKLAIVRAKESQGRGEGRGDGGLAELHDPEPAA